MSERYIAAVLRACGLPMDWPAKRVRRRRRSFYNVERLHSHLDYVRPIEFELKAYVIAIAESSDRPPDGGKIEEVLPPASVLPQTMTGTFDGARLAVKVRVGLDGNAGDTSGSLTAYVKALSVSGPFSLTHQSGDATITLTSNQTTSWAALGCGPTTECDVTAQVREAVSGPDLQGDYAIGTFPLHLTTPTAVPPRAK